MKTQALDLRRDDILKASVTGNFGLSSRLTVLYFSSMSFYQALLETRGHVANIALTLQMHASSTSYKGPLSIGPIYHHSKARGHINSVDSLKD